MNENRFTELKNNILQYAGRYRMQDVAAYVRQNCGGDVEKLLEEASLLMRQTVVFESRFGGEPCKVAHKMDEEMWIQHLEENPQWVYMLNRHDFLYELLGAYVLTGEKMYAVKLRWYIFDWMIKNPVALSGTETTRPVDTGIRCFNWCGLILHMIAEDIIDEEDTVVYLQNMAMQFEYLRRKYVGSNTLSSQGIMQTTAMCAAYLWFREFLPQGNDWEMWAWRELCQQLKLQVLEDGSYWNQSGVECVEVLEVCQKLLLHCKNAQDAGVELSAAAKAAAEAGSGWLFKAVQRMSRHILYAAKPNHKYSVEQTVGETDVRDLMIRTAVLTAEENQKESVYRFAGTVPVDMKSAWLLGAAAIAEYEELKPAEPAEKSFCCEGQGNLYIRSNWSDEADYVQLRRKISVSGFEPSFAELSNYYKEQGDVGYAELISHGLLNGQLYCLNTFKLLMIDGGIWVLQKETKCQDPDKAEACFTLEIRERPEDNCWHLECGDVVFELYSKNALGFQPQVMKDQVLLTSKEIQVKKAAVFQFGRPAPLSGDIVGAWDFRLSSGVTWTVVLWKQAPKNGSQLFMCHGVPIGGKVVVLREENGEYRAIRLKN